MSINKDSPIEVEYVLYYKNERLGIYASYLEAKSAMCDFINKGYESSLMPGHTFFVIKQEPMNKALQLLRRAEFKYSRYPNYTHKMSCFLSFCYGVFVRSINADPLKQELIEEYISNF